MVRLSDTKPARLLKAKVIVALIEAGGRVQTHADAEPQDEEACDQAWREGGEDRGHSENPIAMRSAL